ncbi:MAG: DEAD/DEAH box helicase family protein, partial [Bacteroidales bacterium]|nr:DEAD/DEAH box helicase family protein [Bacteroidales bacterium]
MEEKKKIIILNKDSEADTCRKEVTPKIYNAGWNDDQILEQRVFTDGRIIVIGKIAKREKPKKADYLLRYSQNFPIAIIEAKSINKTAGDGLQQAKDYAEILQLKFAYSTNGQEIIEYDYITGHEKEINEFPSPQELWNRLNKANPIKKENVPILLQPFYPNPDKPPRYYQVIAINRTVQAILEGKPRVLLTMATGTGKTTTAFQIIYKLWSNRWNTKGEYRRPKILFVADRSVLIEDPHSKDFAVFEDARCLIPEDGAVTSREIYFSTYQSLAEDSHRLGKFRKFPRNFFDLIVIDECHRGSASDESNWRVILDYFNTSVKLGLTATPLRNDNRDTYLYFGNPIYTYSLKQGIEDGFLAPYLVHYVTPSTDTQHGWRPLTRQKDKYGNEIPDGVYTTLDFERNLSLLPRTKAVAKHLSELMSKNGRLDKTIIFCVNQDHADQMRRELNNLNTDLVKQNPNYVVRIV